MTKKISRIMFDRNTCQQVLQLPLSRKILGAALYNDYSGFVFYEHDVEDTQHKETKLLYLRTGEGVPKDNPIGWVYLGTIRLKEPEPLMWTHRHIYYKMI